MSTDSSRGRFVWFDLMTPDPAGAKAFYTKVADWGTQLWGQQAADSYEMWTSGEAPLGGVVKLPDEAVAGGARPHWMAHVTVPDVDAAARRAEEIGGRIVNPPQDIPTVGRFAVIADPSGATISMYKPLKDAPEAAPGMPAVGQFSWHELATRDVEKAFDFYRELFGWEKTQAMDMGPNGIYQMYGRNGQPLGGMFVTHDENRPPAWLHYIRVADIERAAEAVRANGGQVVMGPHEVPGGDMIIIGVDPQGGAFALHSSKS